jgi:hypothetical protein
MPVTAAASQPGVLAPGDVRRPAIGLAVRRALAAATLFTVFTVLTKEVRPVYAHVPWADDPYDTFVSFAIFFVPLAIGVAVGRLFLCRRAEPLPAARVAALVRATWLALGASVVTLAADWAGVLMTWPAVRPDAAAAASILALAVTSAAVVGTAAGMLRIEVPRVARPHPDGLADLAGLLRLLAQRLGLVGRPALALATFIDGSLAPAVRRHPTSWAAGASCAFGASLALAAVREEGLATVDALFFGVAACGMFAFLMAGGAWLGLVAGAPSTAGHRRLSAAATAGAGAVPVALAFRDAIWSATGTGGERDLASLAILVAAAGTGAFIVVLAVLTAARRPG